MNRVYYSLTTGNYAATIDLIMDFLSLPLSEEVKASLVQNMQFYDISTSYYYRMGKLPYLLCACE
jgi:hypothetical protein